MLEKFICFDIGGTKIYKSVVEINFAKREFEILDSEKVANLLDHQKIQKLILEYSKKKRIDFETNKIAISTAKIVDFENQIVKKAKPVYGVDEFNFDFLKKEGFQVVVENDGKAFALGSFYFDKNEDKKGLLTLTLGSGIGGGFIAPDGNFFRGFSDSSFEFSHIKMFTGKDWQTWENISTARGLRADYKKITGQPAKAEEIFSNVKKDSVSKEVVDKAQIYLGQGLANLINIFNPEKVVFGGGISLEKEYLEGAIKIAEENVFNSEAIPEWQVSKLREEANVLGVCSLYYI